MAVVNSVSIDYVHEEIHEGKHYIFSRTKTMDTVTANTVVITTPASASGFIHLVCDVESTNAGNWTISESPEQSAGSVLTAYNNNRNSSNKSGISVNGGVVWTSVGTILETHYIGANARAGNGMGRTENEYILKPSTAYGVRFANSAATCYSTVNLAFYVEG
jgi:hypothetical protein